MSLRTSEWRSRWGSHLPSAALLRNAGSLFGTALVTNILGVGFWVLTKRLIPGEGSFAAAYAAINLMIYLSFAGVVGMGSLLIVELASRDRGRAALVGGAVRVALYASTMLASIFVILKVVGLLGLEAVLADNLAMAVLFIVGVAASAVATVVDQASLGVHRGGLQLTRNMIFSVVKLMVLPGLLFSFVTDDVAYVYAAWTFGVVTSLGYFVYTCKDAVATAIVQPAVRQIRELLPEAWNHHVVNLAINTPRLVVPVLIASQLLDVSEQDPFANAYLISMFAAGIPVHLTTMLYAIKRRDEDKLRAEGRGTWRLCFILSVVAVPGFLVGSWPALRIFGPEVTAAVPALWILGLTIMPTAIKQHFVAISRVRGTMWDASKLLWPTAMVELAVFAAGAYFGGMLGAALGIVIGQVIVAVLVWKTVSPVVGGFVPKLVSGP